VKRFKAHLHYIVLVIFMILLGLQGHLEVEFLRSL